MKTSKTIIFIVMLSIIFFSGMRGMAFAEKWGFQTIEHHNDGTWFVVGGITNVYSDGTGITAYNYNSNGHTGSDSESFTTSIAPNPDGSFTMKNIFSDWTQISRCVISDNEKMIICDGTNDTGKQTMEINVRMDESKVYTNADLNWDFYAIGYDYDSVGTNWPGNYIAWSSTGFFDGNGSYSFTNTFNGDGIVSTFNDTDAYSVNSDGSILFTNGKFNGYMAEGLALFSSPTVNNKWEIGLVMEKDRTYSTADLAGTWAIAGFGDDNGNSFNAEFGTMTCDSSGNCLLPLKNQRDGSIGYETLSVTLSVASDGSFGDSVNPDIPSYAGAIGNNGNAIIFNVSFEPGQLYHREIFIGVRCSGCSNLVEHMIPMLSLNLSGSGGTVSSSDKLINCGDDCGEPYPISTKPKKVTLKEKPDANSYFAGWDGDCAAAGTKSSCTLTMDSDKNATANFLPNPTLTLTKSGEGNGNVKSAPKGIDCGVDCTTGDSQFKYKAKVTLKAKADQYSTFLGWSGDACSGTTKPTCKVSMDASKNVTAQFGLPDISVSPTTHDFGDVKIKTLSGPVTFTITNNGIGNLKITKMEITGTDAKDAKMFKKKGGGKKTIKPGASLDFSVTFKSTTTGGKTATLRITSNDPDESPLEIQLSGTGIE